MQFALNMFAENKSNILKVMNKNVFKFYLISSLVLLFTVYGGNSAFAQTVDLSVSGKVLDETNLPLPGANVSVKDTRIGTVTDADGNFLLKVSENAVLVISYLGYESQHFTIVKGKTKINCKLLPDAETLNEVVVVGYGSMKKKDLTGSVSNITAKDFNKGLTNSPAQLLNGKLPGVQIVSGGGSPSSGSTIRIRGGASLNASNDPLIIVDGVPLERGNIVGTGDLLSLINPNDIESMSVLKDASSTAIYGSRASNGVIMITTKRGRAGKTEVIVSSTNSIQTVARLPQMLSADQFRTEAVKFLTPEQQRFMGNAQTNWFDQIFRQAFGTDNNVSVSGGIGKYVPYRFSAGFISQDGVLKTDNYKRTTLSLSLTPSFFNDYLKFNINAKYSINSTHFPNTAAISDAMRMDPTQSVYSGKSEWGGYFEYLKSDGMPNLTNQPFNPLGRLMQTSNVGTVNRFLGNFDVDYKLHFFPELRAHITVGYDRTDGEQESNIPSTAAFTYQTKGMYSLHKATSSNYVFSSYLNYNKEFAAIKSTLDVTAGYDYQDWLTKSPAYKTYKEDKTVEYDNVMADYQRHVLMSFYGRINYSFNDRYLLTATIRTDGTSRFSKNNRWGVFPSVAAAWKLKNESLFKDKEKLSDLKLRLGWGVTGQQDGIGNYNYIPVYQEGTSQNQYPFGKEFTIINGVKAAYDENLKWETTKTYNFGLDFGFWDQRLSGSVDYYTRRTTDLIARAAIPAGTNFGGSVITNVGSLKSNGVEVALNVIPIATKDWNWNIGLNMTYQNSKVDKIALVDDPNSPGLITGVQLGYNYIQILKPGESPYSWFLREQVYEKGKPKEGEYVDRNKDGSIDGNDQTVGHRSTPNWLLGFNTQLDYKKWSLNIVMRANLGQYNYNGVDAEYGTQAGAFPNTGGVLVNRCEDYLYTGFMNNQNLSDYYVQNASFLKLDNLSLSYNFGQVAKCMNLKLGAQVQNLFTITSYKGTEPEIQNAYDGSFYPRARIYSLNLILGF